MQPKTTTTARLLLGFVLALVALGGIAHAGPKEDVTAAMQKLLAARSWHATMKVSGAQSMTNELDFVAPDRFRIAIEGLGTQYIIGDTMVMTMQGKTMRVPLQKDMLGQYRDPARLREHNATMTVQALGKDVVAGKPARKYRVRNPKDGDLDVLMWIGGNGYPIQIQVDGKAQGQASTTLIRYSRFNDPTIRVSAP
jgi:outer membrane lipoprotein-sorting protein